ncbi:hypothetical protein BDN71DRAFT_1506009 [Pleurotus eryngii]|uniref:Uncharacterized protein n=1 Tax=Pleurotus eryngii TaxID=5323 RepID=A0A9P5ZX53_PLEER|nr:hypothetical protein BDN71DRAFT_1506009 [Pleurotus eryngii]
MSLKRTYTSPHPLTTKAVSPALRRTNSHHHLASLSYEVPPQQSPRVIKEDPFSLSGFFPSALAGTEEDRDEWNWLSPESVEPATSPESYSLNADYADLVDTIVALDVSGEEELMTRTIEKEDKLGILSLARVLGGRDEEYKQEEYRMLSPYLADDPVDDNALYMNLCARRESHSRGFSWETETGFDGLFFPQRGMDDIAEAEQQSLLETMFLGRTV